MYNPPPYSFTHFVNRAEEIRLVRETAQCLAQQKRLKERAFLFTGQRGSGKTWLLHHLDSILKKELETKANVALIDLSKWSKLSTPEDFAREVMSDFVQQIGARAGYINDEEKENVPLERWAEWLVHDVQQMAHQGHLMTLLLDTVYESEWDYLSMLEDVFLGPLVVEPNVLVVIAGRGQLYRWRLPELWIYGQARELKPFEEPQVRKMLNKMSKEEEEEEEEKEEEEGEGEGGERSTQIYQLSGGYPYVVWLLSQHDVTTYQAALEEALAYMLPPDIVDLRNVLDALCVLRAFDEDRIQALTTSDSSESSKILKRLAKPKLVWYEQLRRGWVLDDAIRHILEQLLKMKNFDKWQQLHNQAQNLYKKWIQWGAEWEEEAQYHSKFLEKEVVKV